MLIDVSEFQGNIDWNKVRNAGITGAIIRCGWGQDMTSQDDAKFTQNMDGAIKAGIKVGIFLYSYAKTADKARGEAKHALRLAKPYKDKLYYPIFIDVEEKSTAPYSKTVCTTFCDEIQANGYKAGIYATTSWWSNQLKGVNDYYKWVAKLGGSAPQGFQFWQYSWKGRIDGISTDVDLDEDLGFSPTPEPTPEPEPTGAPVDITLNVIKEGDEGIQVRTLQRLLKELGYLDTKGNILIVDGKFGSNSKFALTNFQRAAFPTEPNQWDGICGERSWNYILKKK